MVEASNQNPPAEEEQQPLAGIDVIEEEPKKKVSKKQQDKDQKKMKNKTKQAITVLCKAEDRPYEELICDGPSKNMFVTHFGNGDEADQDLVIKYIREQGCTVEAITIIPGNNYGLVVLGSA